MEKPARAIDHLTTKCLPFRKRMIHIWEENDIWVLMRHQMEGQKDLPFRKRVLNVLKETEFSIIVSASLETAGESSGCENQPLECDKFPESCEAEPLNLKVETKKTASISKKSGLSKHLDNGAAIKSKKQYTCLPCRKTFADLKRFKDHQRRDRHKAANIYQCNFCKKSYGQKSSLICHQRSHTNERPYACHYCSKRFTDQSTYTKHLRVHTGMKPYTCEMCLQQFSQSGNLIRHQKTIHKKN